MTAKRDEPTPEMRSGITMDQTKQTDIPYRLLGISNRNVSPFGLLGISPEKCERKNVLRALQSQLARIDRHPESATPEAHHLRRLLQKAADQLLAAKSLEKCRRAFYGNSEPPQPHQTPRQPTNLTDSPENPPSARRASSHQPHLVSDGSETRLERTGASTSPTPPPPPQRRTTLASPLSRRIANPINEGITLAIASAGGWNARARRRIASVAMENNLAPETLVSRILETVTESGWRHVDAWNVPNAQPSPIAQPGTTGSPTARPSRVPTLQPARQQSPAASPGISNGAGVAGASPTSSSIQQMASAAATASASPIIPEPPYELSEEELAHRAAMRNLTAAFITFFIALLVTLPFGIYILYEINSPSITSSDQWTSDSNTSNPDTTISDINSSTSSNKADTLPPSSRRNTTPTKRMPLTFAAALDELERQVRAADGLSEATLKNYRILVEQVRHTWVRFDDASLERIRSFIVSSLYEKGIDETTAAAILEAVDSRSTVSSAGLTTSENVVSAIWSQAMIAILSVESDLPAPTRKELERHQRRQARLVLNNSPAQQRIPFRQAVQRSLQNIAPQLVEQHVGPNAWGAWTDALRSTDPDPAAFERLTMTALYQMLVDPTESASSDSVRSITLLLMDTIRWNRATEARRTILSWFNDPRLPAAHLSVITGYLVTAAQIAGLDDSFILAPTAGLNQRARLREQLAAAWKPSSNSPDMNSSVAIDSDMADWTAHAQQALPQPLPESTEDSLKLLLQIARLNTSAYLFESMETQRARDFFRSTNLELLNSQIDAEIQALRATFTANNNTNPNANQALSEDGDFAIKFAATTEANDRDGREELIRNLYDGVADDLGPVDAASLVQLAVAGSPRALRQLTADTIVKHFANGPNVLRRLADTLSPEQPSKHLADLIEQITSRQLPDTKSRNWYADARFALLQHILNITGSSAKTSRVNALAALLAQSYTMRGGADSKQQIEQITDPARGAEDCFETWIVRGTPMLPITPIPASLRDIKRRRETRYYFQRDSIGAFAANQMGVLEAAIYVTAAERPAASDELLQILDDSNERRSAADTSIHQLIEVERAILRVWMIRVRFAWGV